MIWYLSGLVLTLVAGWWMYRDLRRDIELEWVGWASILVAAVLWPLAWGAAIVGLIIEETHNRREARR